MKMIFCITSSEVDGFVERAIAETASLSCHPLARHANSTYCLRGGVTRRGRDNLICNVFSPRLEHIRTRRWLKLQPWIAHSAALLRVTVLRFPSPNKTLHPFCLLFFYPHLKIVSLIIKGIYGDNESIQYRSLLIFYFGSQGSFLVVLGQRHEQSRQTLDRRDSPEWLNAERHSHGYKNISLQQASLGMKDPPIFSLTNVKKVIRTISRWLHCAEWILMLSSSRHLLIDYVSLSAIMRP